MFHGPAQSPPVYLFPYSAYVEQGRILDEINKSASLGCGEVRFAAGSLLHIEVACLGLVDTQELEQSLIII
jgi:hypothetical protein